MAKVGNAKRNGRVRTHTPRERKLQIKRIRQRQLFIIDQDFGSGDLRYALININYATWLLCERYKIISGVISHLKR